MFAAVHKNNVSFALIFKADRWYFTVGSRVLKLSVANLSFCNEFCAKIMGKVDARERLKEEYNAWKHHHPQASFFNFDFVDLLAVVTL